MGRRNLEEQTSTLGIKQDSIESSSNAPLRDTNRVEGVTVCFGDMQQIHKDSLCEAS